MKQGRLSASWIICFVLTSLFVFVHYIPYWQPNEPSINSRVHTGTSEYKVIDSKPDKIITNVTTIPKENHFESKDVNQNKVDHEQNQKVDSSKASVPHVVSKSLSDKKGLDPLSLSPMSWNQFVSIPLDDSYKGSGRYPPDFNARHWMDYKPNVCSADIVNNLAKPRLETKEVEFCKWALDPNGGKVIVGKSWGKLSRKEDKERFDSLNCNSVNEGKNPSCDDSWGDKHIYDWRNDIMETFQCNSGKSSKVTCHRNDNKDLYCTIDNAQIRFNKMRKIKRPGNTPSKVFEQDFLSADCTDEKHPSKDFPFPHLYSPSLSSNECDYIYNSTLLLYSHDDIRNVGHTMNDIMNIWVMLWMEGLARYSTNIDMLNVDSFKLGHNFDDQPNRFFETYTRNLRKILKGVDFDGKTLCVKRLLLQPIPPRFFIWESWFVDLPCSFIGPSSLYQRFNHHVRYSYEVMNNVATNERITILLIVRNEHSNMWGSQRTSRNYLNLPEIEDGLQKLIRELGSEYHLIVQDLGLLSFSEQFKLMASTSLVIGMHGAGISTTMHMSIGTKYCCGVLEIYPAGEFSPIKGHGNMARKMGIHYDRVDISPENSRGNGATVPVASLVQKTRLMLETIKSKPSCVLPEVLEKPFFD